MERLEDSAPTGPPVSGSAEGSAPDELGVMRAAPFLAALTGGAAIIHIAMAPVHASGSSVEAIGFAVSGLIQAALAITLLVRPRKEVFGATAALNLVLIGLWAWSRATGLPFGAHPGEAEAVGSVDLAAVLLEGGAVLGAIARLVTPSTDERKMPMVVPVIGAIAVLALATAVVASPEAAEHAHGDDEYGGEHDHGGTAEQDALLATIQDTRCDLSFNTKSYFEETEYIGIDTVSNVGLSGHDHTSATEERTDPLSGRGSEMMDDLTANINTESEATAGMMTAKLGNVSEEEYQAFLYQMWKNNQASGGHSAHAATGDDTEGHGGHFGPQPWVAITDADQCATLQDELDLARETALKYPTAKDAEEAGYRMVTTYVPGIASHWMNFRYVDGVFEVDKPEMLLYDGIGPDASVIGLSYYVMHEADTEPTQGFTGDNDHYHRHVGLCIRGTTVVGDTTLSEEECAEIGGVKQNGGAGWMSHAWVVPGCESPWGLFSGVNPILDGSLGKSSGSDGGGCAGSGVLDRYDQSPADRDDVEPSTGTASENAAG